MPLPTKTCKTCGEVMTLLPGMTDVFHLHKPAEGYVMASEGGRLVAVPARMDVPPENFGPLTDEWEQGIRKEVAGHVARYGRWGMSWKDYALLALLGEIDRLRAVASKAEGTLGTLAGDEFGSMADFGLSASGIAKAADSTVRALAGVQTRSVRFPLFMPDHEAQELAAAVRIRLPHATVEVTLPQTGLAYLDVSDFRLDADAPVVAEARDGR